MRSKTRETQDGTQLVPRHTCGNNEVCKAHVRTGMGARGREGVPGLLINFVMRRAATGETLAKLPEANTRRCSVIRAHARYTRDMLQGISAALRNARADRPRGRVYDMLAIAVIDSSGECVCC